MVALLGAVLGVSVGLDRVSHGLEPWVVYNPDPQFFEGMIPIRNWVSRSEDCGRTWAKPWLLECLTVPNSSAQVLVTLANGDVVGPVETFKRNLSVHWLAEDGYEDGAIANRVKFVAIDPAKGTAAGYIAKYVGKNIDGSQGGAHDEEGQAMLDGVAPACERVDAWASVWGIRQFQGIGTKQRWSVP